jgi:hypothetical protein
MPRTLEDQGTSKSEKAIWDGFDLDIADDRYAGIAPDLPPHLIALPEGDWALWRWSGLRSCGFPTREVLRLSAPEEAKMADRVLRAQFGLERAKKEVVHEAHRQIGRAGKSEKKQWDKALKSLKRGEHPLNVPQALSALERLKTAREQFDSVWEEYLLVSKVAAKISSRAIRELADNDLFKEAVIWQNRRAFHTAIAPLLRRQMEDDSTDSKTRQREQLVASYVQRYCTKNDTIGFFGPVGWARFDPAHFSIAVTPGANLISKRTVYFEAWCIDALGEILSGDERIRPWIVPRRMPFARLEGTLLYAQAGNTIRLDPQQAAIFEACDGSHTAKEIATILKSEFASGPGFEDEVYSGLRSLRAMGVAVWELEACLDLYPERTLRQLLQTIQSHALREEVLALLDRLEASRDEVASAAGDPDGVDAALERLETTFTQMTARSATRYSGETYAGRTLVFEDCQRNVDVTIGYDVVKRFGPPLSLLLDSARWFTFALAESLREAFDRIFDELSPKTGQATAVDYLAFWPSVTPLLFDEEKSVANKVLKLFQEKWKQVFSPAEDRRCLEYKSEHLRPQVASLFAAPGPGWSFARYHNADFLIAAKGVESIQRGDYKCILGELHIAANTLGVPLFMEQHDSPDELSLAAEIDLPEPRLIPIVSKDWAHVSPRLVPALVSAKDFHLELTTVQHRIPRSKLVMSESLVIDRSEGNLVVRTRKGRLRFDVIEAFASMIGVLISNKFTLFEPEGHTPRISIDDLVVSRETWRFCADELSFASQKDDALRFLQARGFINDNRIPQCAFVKAPVEVKPFYVDFSSPIYVNILSKIIRRCMAKSSREVITISEMLPGIDECWLPDSNGELYASEVRIIAVDQRLR